MLIYDSFQASQLHYIIFEILQLQQCHRLQLTYLNNHLRRQIRHNERSDSAVIDHSNHSISLQLNSLTYTRPQAPIVHELSLGGPSFLLHSVQLVVVEVVVLLLPLFGLCLLPHNSFSSLALWFFPFPKKSGKVHEK